MTLKEFEMQSALGSIDYDDLIELAKNPSTSIEILTVLSRHKNRAIHNEAFLNQMKRIGYGSK